MTPSAQTHSSSARRRAIQNIGLFVGPIAAVLTVALLPANYQNIEGQTVAFTFAGRATLGLMIWMAIWWLTEAIDISATALLPVVILPLSTVQAFNGASGAIAAATKPYADPLIALFMGGFLIALAMQRWGLDRRIALLTLRLVGTGPRQMIAGFMLATALLSMFVSNTATTAMMLPIGLSVIALIAQHKNNNDTADNVEPQSNEHDTQRSFALCLMLGIAYAASIGGVGTIIGTPPNVFLVGFLKSSIAEPYRVEISFVKWMAIGLPVVLVFLPLCWYLLTHWLYPVHMRRLEGGRAFIRDTLRSLGPVKSGEWATLIVFLATALLWIFRPLIQNLTIGSGADALRPLAGLTDPGIAILAAMALFVIPVNLREREFVLTWSSARKLPWGILILFGGGLSLAGAVQRFGVAEYLGNLAGNFAGLPILFLVLIVVAGVIFLTELTSNTATTAALLPILAAVAPALNMHPYTVVIPATIAASCAFMMPVATPPNAIVFGSGRVTIPQMARAGLWLNIAGIVLITLLAYAIVLPLLGVGAGL